MEENFRKAVHSTRDRKKWSQWQQNVLKMALETTIGIIKWWCDIPLKKTFFHSIYELEAFVT